MLWWLLACGEPTPVVVEAGASTSEIQAYLGCPTEEECARVWPNAVREVERAMGDATPYLGQVLLAAEEPDDLLQDPFVRHAMQAAYRGMLMDLEAYGVDDLSTLARTDSPPSDEEYGGADGLEDGLGEAFDFFLEGRSDSDDQDASDYSFLGVRGIVRAAARSVASTSRSVECTGERLRDLIRDVVQANVDVLGAAWDLGGAVVHLADAAIQYGAFCAELAVSGPLCSSDGTRLLDCGLSGFEGTTCDDDGTPWEEICLRDEGACSDATYDHDQDGVSAADGDCDDGDLTRFPRPFEEVSYNECYLQADLDCDEVVEPVETCMCEHGLSAPRLGSAYADSTMVGEPVTGGFVMSSNVYGGQDEEGNDVCGVNISRTVYFDIAFPEPFDPDVIGSGADDLTWSWSVVGGPISVVSQDAGGARIRMNVPGAPVCGQTHGTFATVEVEASDCSGMFGLRTLDLAVYRTPRMGSTP